jgi:hypothetical protein
MRKTASFHPPALGKAVTVRSRTLWKRDNNNITNQGLWQSLEFTSPAITRACCCLMYIVRGTATKRQTELALKSLDAESMDMTYPFCVLEMVAGHLCC